MKSFIINLEFRKDRLEKLNYNLINNYTIFNAINYEKLVEEDKLYYNNKLFRDEHTNFLDGAKGCFISHYLVLCEIANQNEYDYAYVFEDDVIIIEEYLFSKVEENLPKDFDILMLGGVFLNRQAPKKGFYKPNFDKSAFCTEAYIVSKNGAKKIVDFINNKTFTTYSIDWYLHFLAAIGSINYYAHEPLLTTQNHSDSNINV